MANAKRAQRKISSPELLFPQGIVDKIIRLGFLDVKHFLKEPCAGFHLHLVVTVANQSKTSLLRLAAGGLAMTLNANNTRLL